MGFTERAAPARRPGASSRSGRGLDARRTGVRPARLVPLAAGALALVIGGGYLAAWMTGIGARWARAGVMTMKTNMSLALVLASAALVLGELRGGNRALRKLGRVLAGAALAIGALTLAEHLLHVDLHIDEVLALEPREAVATTSPNRFGLPGCLGLIFLGSGLLVLRWKRSVAQYLGLATLFVTAVPAVGFLYEVGALYRNAQVTAIAWVTVVALSALAVGLVFAAGRQDRRSLLWRHDAAGALLRRLWPATVALPIALGLLRARGERLGLYAPSLGDAAMALALVVIFSLMLWRSASTISASSSMRERATEALRDNEARLRAIFESAAIGIVEVDENDRFVAVNERFCEMLGYGREELLRMTLHDVTAPEDAEVTRDLNAKGQTGELSRFDYEKRYVRRDGSRVWVHVNVSVVHDEAGRFVRAIGTAADITERKGTEVALRDSEARLRLTLDAAKFGTFDLDVATGRLVWDVPKMRMWGISEPEDFRYPAVLDRLHPEDRARVAAMVEASFRTGEYESEYRVVWPDGSVRWLYARGRVEYDGDRPVRMLGVELDITDRKVAEQALAKANARLLDADRRKDEFLGMLSHELRNPLAPIRNALYVLEHADPAGRQADRAKAIASRQVAHLTRLVDDLLDVTRIARGKIEVRHEPIDLAALAQRTGEDYRPLMQDRGLDLALELPREPAMVTGDPARLTQVLGNLLSNAAKFTPAGGRVTVAVRSERGRAVVRVRDTGPGISPDVRGTLFEPFTQGKQSLARSEGGLGLGLSLVKGLVALHGGDVDATTTPGGGAELVVSIPLVDEAPARARAPAGDRTGDRTHAAAPVRRVLVVDDNRDAADSLAQLVSLAGHRPEVAYDAPAGLAIATERLPDVVLCDLGLPGMDGYELARQLRARAGDRRVRLVAVTGYVQPEDVARAREAGFDAHVAKPVDPDRIESLLS